MNRLSLNAPALIGSWGILLSILILLTDLPQVFLYLAFLISVIQFVAASKTAIVTFISGCLIGFLCTSLQISIPEKGLFNKGEAEVEVLEEIENSRGMTYKVHVVQFSTETGEKFYGFCAFLRGKKNQIFELDTTYSLSCILQRDDFGFRIKSPVVRDQKSSSFPIHQMRTQVREYCFLRSAGLYEPSDERTFIETVTFGGKLNPIRRAQLNRFGLDHIAAVSGFHFGLVAGFAWWLSLLLFRGVVSRLVVIGALLCYGIIVGPQASVLRALFAASLFVVAPFFSRRANGLNNLGVGLGVLLLYEPLFVFSMGFQLSFAATLGILLLYKPLSHFLSVGRGHKGDFLVMAFCVSFSALIMALSIQIVQTGAFSFLGPIYNLIIPLFVG